MARPELDIVVAGRVAVAVAFAIGIAAFLALGGSHWLTLDALRTHRAALIDFSHRHLAVAIALAFAFYATVIALSLPGALVLSVACGVAFGRWVGTAVSVASATTGAAILLVAARYVFADAARRRLGARGRTIAASFADHAWSYMLFLRLVPLFPFVLVNLASAFAPIPLSTYVLATAIGIVPGTFVYANLGEALARVDSVDALASRDVLVALALLGALALAPIAAGRFRSRRARP